MAKITDLSSSKLNSSTSSEKDLSVSSRSNGSLRVAEKKRRNEAEDPFLIALKYFSEVEAGTPVLGNDVLEANLVYVEKVGLSQGLPPEAVSVMLEFAMSLRMGTGPCSRVLKFLIPASVVPQEAVVRAMAWLCTGKIPASTQILFLKWVLTMFDMIDSKDQLRAIYGFIFSFAKYEDLSPFICHLLYLLTRRESVCLFRVRKLLELQSKMGRQPFLSHLLSLYKVFRPELVTLSLPSRMRSGFKNHSAPWKAGLSVVQRRASALTTSGVGLTLGASTKTSSKKRKLHHLELPSLSPTVQSQAGPASSSSSSSSCRKVLPLVQLHSFSQLLENLHHIELPAQMGSLLGSSLALHYLDCVQDESAFLCLNYWLGHALHEEFLFCSDSVSQSSDEVLQFLHMLLSTQNFLQEGFTSTETFLYKFLSVWDGSLFRPQILGLLSDIPVVPSSCISQLLFEPLMQLFFSSTLSFKCSVLDCLNSMLLKWLTWHSVYALEDGLDISLNSHTPMSMTLSGFMDSVMELVSLVGRLASAGLQMEACHSLLLSHVLDFYQTVCDMFLKYSLPLVLLPPKGVFFPALLATDPVSVDRLAHIMVRYKNNLTSAKSQDQKMKAFHISRQTYKDFNAYLLTMVGSLWNSKTFLPGTALETAEKVLEGSKVPEYWRSFDFIHHPAFFSLAVVFHHQCWPERRHMDLNSIKNGKHWDWYLEFLFNQGLEGLRQFVHSNINRRPPADRSLSQRDGQAC